MSASAWGVDESAHLIPGSVSDCVIILEDTTHNTWYGIITSSGRIGERLSASGTRLNSSSPVPYGGGGGGGGNKSSTESVRGLKSVSRQSLLDIVSCRFGVGRTARQQHQHTGRSYFSSSRDSLSAAYVNRAAAVSTAASELDLSRKARRRELRDAPSLLGRWGERASGSMGPGE
ncbi:uncharacterized protein LOC126160344 [Schistocerca cancellata]|uniref:uncharacterized protein LOC126160344 n=1 Tax=Schistocerca cancellata TaxID=274614 RepID=UPI002118D3B3|nr:uncharacterized protein LOC126160344 [Schistocerca cancellata]